MDLSVWASVDDYLGDLLLPDDPALEATLATAAEAGLPAIHVPPLQGRFLELLVRVTRARRVLEIGTLAGYSTLWMARSLPPDGLVVTLEADPEHAALAQRNIDGAGFTDRIRLIPGPALDTLPSLRDAPVPFDLVFIDADKVNNAAYVRWAVDLGRPGTVVVVDNVVRGGAVVDASSDDAAVVGTRQVLELLSSDPRLDATALQTVGAKGYDGFALAIVR